MPSLKDVLWRSRFQDRPIRQLAALLLVLGGSAVAEGLGWFGDGGPLWQVLGGIPAFLLGVWLMTMVKADRS